jgi:hypothetical protein
MSMKSQKCCNFCGRHTAIGYVCPECASDEWYRRQCRLCPNFLEYKDSIYCCACTRSIWLLTYCRHVIVTVLEEGRLSISCHYRQLQLQKSRRKLYQDIYRVDDIFRYCPSNCPKRRPLFPDFWKYLPDLYVEAAMGLKEIECVTVKCREPIIGIKLIIFSATTVYEFWRGQYRRFVRHFIAIIPDNYVMSSPNYLTKVWMTSPTLSSKCE